MNCLNIHYFPIVHNAICLPPKFCINYCCEILLGGLHIPESIPQQVYAKFGGQTECIMGNWKIVDIKVSTEGDSIRWNGGMMERRNGMAEHTEYSKTRNTRNILKHGIHGIF